MKDTIVHAALKFGCRHFAQNQAQRYYTIGCQTNQETSRHTIWTKSNRKQSPKHWCLNFLVENESFFYEGYNSDGRMGPFWGALDAEGDQLFEESPLAIPPLANKSNAAD